MPIGLEIFYVYSLIACALLLHLYSTFDKWSCVNTIIARLNICVGRSWYFVQ